MLGASREPPASSRASASCRREDVTHADSPERKDVKNMEKNVTVKIDCFAVRLTRPRIETEVVKCGSSRCDFLTYPDSYFPKFSPPLDLCMARS